MEKRILYIHGLSSSGASSTAKKLCELLPEYEVLSPDLPLNPEEALFVLQSLCCEKDPQVIIGTSMGAMFAQQIRGYKKILANPAFHVSEFMRGHIGTNVFLNPRQDGATSYEITPALCDAYQKLEHEQFASSNLDRENTFALFGNKDTLVNGYDEYKTHYEHAEWFDGEHRLNEENVQCIIVPLIKFLAGEKTGEHIEALLEKSPLFNLSLSSKELFHSNFLYWIGSKYPDLFVAICKELGCSAHWVQNWTIEREYNNYDLCIKGSKDDILFVLENKVKSIPNKKQLDKYADELEALKNPPEDLVLLSLVTVFSDKKDINSGAKNQEKSKWKINNYKDLYNAIIRYKDRFVTDQYDLLLMKDYCLFIKCLHELTATWGIKDGDKFLPQKEMKEICKRLRINDLYEKIWYNQAFDRLKDKLSELNIQLVSGTDIKDIKENQDPPLKNIFINWGFTHGQGLLEAKVKVPKIEKPNESEYVLLIQIQGDRYCHGVEWIKSSFQSHTKYWEDTKKDELIRKLSFFQFEEGNNTAFPDDVCKEGFISPRNTKEGTRLYNKYGDRFLYQSMKIKDDACFSEVLDAIKKEICTIINEATH